MSPPPPPEDDDPNAGLADTTQSFRQEEAIIIKRVKKVEEGHHGGAWKIAYADFVTAMMAFFLLMWLISTTSPEQKEGLAEYFSPPNISESNSGAGGLLGGTDLSEDGSKRAGSSADVLGNGSQDTDKKRPEGEDDELSRASQTDLRSEEDRAFHSAAVSIRQAWQANSDITGHANNLIVEETKEGLDILIVNQDDRRMFAQGSKYPLEVTRQALAAIAPILQKLSNQIKISGHTAAGATYNNSRYDAWDLSSDRANIARRVLSEFGLSQDHVHSVVGRGAEEPFFPNDPLLSANERIKITVLHTAPAVPLSLKP